MADTNFILGTVIEADWLNDVNDLVYTGSATDVTINGVTVGLGTGAVATNTVVGRHALFVNTTGLGNCGFGYNSLQANTTGIGNVGVGYATVSLNVSGSYNTGLGSSALQQTTGSYNTGVGNNSGSGITTGSKNVIIGGYKGALTPISQTGSNYVVLSDGDANVRAYWNGTDATFIGALRVVDLVGTNAAATTLPSATTITPTKAITFVSGTTAVVTITVPSNFTGAGGSVTLIPTGTFTWTAAGNIALAGTAVVNKALTMTYDSGTTKWYPSYV